MAVAVGFVVAGVELAAAVGLGDGDLVATGDVTMPP